MKEAGPNYFQAATSAEKLRGKYYTPPELVRLILRTVDLHPGDIVLDPSCGDGEFLVEAVRFLAGRVEAPDRAGLARELCRRIVGMDVQPEAVAQARERLAEAIRELCGIRPPDEQIHVLCRSALELPTRDALAREVLPPVGRLLVLGNPPYVEAKRLPAATKAELRARYPAATSGAPDLYVYFLHACLSWLRDGDRLAFVLPNKVLVNSNAREVRESLLSADRLLGIQFATRNGLFGGAGVYPIVLYAGGTDNGNSGAVELARVEAAGQELEARPLPELPRELYGATRSRAFFPSAPEGSLDRVLRSLLVQVEEGRLDDVLDVRWSVSFHRRGLRERYVLPDRPASPHARQFLGGGPFSGNGEVTRYGIRWGGWWIDYDRDALRADGNVLPDAEMFDRTKVAICQNGRTLRAAFDADGYVLKDTFLCGLPRESAHPLADHPRALVGLLCSRVIHFFYSHVFYGGHVNGGYLHFLRSFLVDVPLGRWEAEAARETARAVAAVERASPDQRGSLIEEVERWVEEAFGFSAEERAAIRAWAEEDENWAARDRVRWRENPGAAG